MARICSPFTLQAIVKGVADGSISKVAVLSGAGISCSAGIPDFWSPGGMYDTLNPDLITASESERKMMRENPTAVVDISLFTQNQFPYLEVRRPFILGTAEQKWKPTISHLFIQLLEDKGILQRSYTQNIDGLDFQLSIPENKIVNVHGSLGKVQCEHCKADYPIDEFRKLVELRIRNIYDKNDSTAPNRSSNILCKSCNLPGVKPATVMYGTSLPEDVWKAAAVDFPDNVDLMIIIGTSLTVHPACDFVDKVAENVPRLLINRDPVGESVGLDYKGENARDAAVLGDCDDGFLLLAEQLGWIPDLYAYKSKMCPNSASSIESAFNRLTK